jgi:hypothetical protein
VIRSATSLGLRCHILRPPDQSRVTSANILSILTSRQHKQIAVVV